MRSRQEKGARCCEMDRLEIGHPHQTLPSHFTATKSYCLGEGRSRRCRWKARRTHTHTQRERRHLKETTKQGVERVTFGTHLHQKYFHPLRRHHMERTARRKWPNQASSKKRMGNHPRPLRPALCYSAPSSRNRVFICGVCHYPTWGPLGWHRVWGCKRIIVLVFF